MRREGRAYEAEVLDDILENRMPPELQALVRHKPKVAGLTGTVYNVCLFNPLFQSPPSSLA